MGQWNELHFQQAGEVQTLGNRTCYTSVYFCSTPGIFFSPLHQLSTAHYFPPNKIMEIHTNSFTWGESAVGRTSSNKKKKKKRKVFEWMEEKCSGNKQNRGIFFVVLSFLKLCIKINTSCKSLCTEEVTQEQSVQVTKYSMGYRNGRTVSHWKAKHCSSLFSQKISITHWPVPQIEEQNSSMMSFFLFAVSCTSEENKMI